jgi:hypothetical protein
MDDACCFCRKLARRRSRNLWSFIHLHEKVVNLFERKLSCALVVCLHSPASLSTHACMAHTTPERCSACMHAFLRTVFSEPILQTDGWMDGCEPKVPQKAPHAPQVAVCCSQPGGRQEEAVTSDFTSASRHPDPFFRRKASHTGSIKDFQILTRSHCIAWCTYWSIWGCALLLPGFCLFN